MSWNALLHVCTNRKILFIWAPCLPSALPSVRQLNDTLVTRINSKANWTRDSIDRDVEIFFVRKEEVWQIKDKVDLGAVFGGLLRDLNMRRKI